jgi:hypothetical protein
MIATWTEHGEEVTVKSARMWEMARNVHKKLGSDAAFSAQRGQKLRKAYLALFPLFPEMQRTPMYRM